MPRRYVPSPERNSDDSEAEEDTPGPDTVKVYVWEFNLGSETEFLDYPTLPAALPADLETARDWRPDYDAGDPEDIKFPSLIKSIYFPQYEGCSRLKADIEDVDGRSCDMAKLFSPYFQNYREIYARGSTIRPSVLLEITVAKKRPKSGPFSKVQISYAGLDDERGFQPGIDKYDAHPLYKQGYKWAIAVDIDRDPVKLDLVSVLMQGHLLSLFEIYPLPPDEDEPEDEELRLEGNGELSGEEDEKLSPEEARARRNAAIEDWVQRGWLVRRT